MSSTSDRDPASAAWWLRVALGDLRAARAILGDPAAPPRAAAAFAQQAAEKALKGAIAYAGTDPPRTHDLVALWALLRARGMNIAEPTDLALLSEAGRGARYPDPDEPPYERSAAGPLIEGAEAVVEAIRIHLRADGMDVTNLEPA